MRVTFFFKTASQVSFVFTYSIYTLLVYHIVTFDIISLVVSTTVTSVVQAGLLQPLNAIKNMT